jgi:glycosyltransferase involved in cell wall biosynthesis
MRTLVIAGDWPWPCDTGSRLRLTTVLRGLLRGGPVELVSVVSQFRSDFDPADTDFGLTSAVRLGFDNRPASGLGLASTLLRPSMPIGLPWRDRKRVQAAIAAETTGRYDLIWVFDPRSWVLSGGIFAAPVVADLVDLEDQKIEARLSLPAPAPGGVATRMRRAAANAVSRDEIRRWRRLHRHIDRGSSAVVLCSDLDAARARSQGISHTAVIPNGYPAVERPIGRPTVGSPPTLLFQGLLTYPANIEAARWLAREVGPALRESVPEARIRLVGKHGPDIAALDDPPTVTVVGHVPDIEDELALADLVVVPLRYGSGTRLKILEAFAQRVPVVSTTLGAEGLGVEDGVHLLIGDSAPALAQACAKVLGDPALREGLTSRAHDLFLERFQNQVVEERVAELAERVVADAAR